MAGNIAMAASYIYYCSFSCPPLPTTQHEPSSVENAILRRPERSTVPLTPGIPALAKKSAIEEAILRSPTTASQSSLDTLPAPQARRAISIVSAIEEALLSTSERALTTEPVPCMDDMPEIPDEDSESYTSLVSPEQLLSVPTQTSSPNHTPLTTGTKASGSRKFHKTRVVPEKAKRNKRGLVKQYMTRQTKTRPCQMGRTSLCNIPEKMPLYLIPRRQGGRIVARKSSRVSTVELKGSCGDENASVSAWMNGDKTSGAGRPRARTSSFSSTKNVLIAIRPL
ncbi:hypothetical protein C8Q78DRAFT_1081844 [Trametes maxima]|nr:hypothetical protein C8Q78DRAFT_1081844 [Trametes maxima]